MTKPNRFILYGLIVVLLSAMSIYAIRSKRKGVTLITVVVFIILGSIIICQMGNLISQEYMFVKMCKFFIYEDPKNASGKDERSLSQEWNMAKIGVGYYLHCYNLNFQQEIKQQIINIGVVQLALYKSCKADIDEFNKEAKKQDDTAKGTYKAQIPSPKNVQDLLNLKSKIDSNSEDLYYCIKHRNAIQTLENLKQSVIRIPNCNSYGPFYTAARKDFCYNGLPNGITMYWSCFWMFIGLVFIILAFFKGEMALKMRIDRSAMAPSQEGCRYQNYSLNKLAKYTMMDKSEITDHDEN